MFVACPQKNEATPNDLYWVGTAGQIVRYITGGEGAHHMVVQGQTRFRASLGPIASSTGLQALRIVGGCCPQQT